MDVAAVSHLPDGTIDIFSAEGIEELYPPQAAAVEAGITDGESLVASVPTASGKTMIAQLAMLSAIDRGGKALYIVPLRALASEKKADFEKFADLGIEVGVATGNYEGRGEWLGGKDLIVATSEKVDSLIRNGAPWIDDLECVVADEIHLIDDSGRGPTLEVTLAKLRRVNPAIQTVGLSATVDNAGAIAEWLDAELVDTDWRPIDLRKGVQYGNAIHYENGDTAELSVGNAEKPTAAIVRDTLEDEGSTLVFVNSRRNAESAAKRLGGAVSPALSPEEERKLGQLAEEIRGESDSSASDDLAACIERGAAFHHAGLTSNQRSLVEDAFRDRLIKVVSATPTLAAGVNTPSRRVVIRDWRRYDPSAGGMAPLPVLEVHQMMGRAGRPGRDPYGEALLVAKSHDELDDLFEQYVYADPEPVRSKLAAEPALRTHVLATIATGFATSVDGVRSFLDETLYASQTEESSQLDSVLDEVLWYLEANDFITEEAGELTATSRGETVSQLYLDPMSAAIIVDGMTAAEGDMSALGLYHLVSRTPDMYELYLRSGDRETYTEIYYEREQELCGDAPSEFEEVEFESWLSALKTGKLLEDWADELDEDAITNRYQIGPGDLRAKVDTAEWLLEAAEQLAADADLGVTNDIRRARRRVADGVTEELLELVGIRNVGRKRARRLYEAGIETREDLRNADKGVVLAALRNRSGTASSILEAVGREDPSMDGVHPEADVADAVTDEDDTSPTQDRSSGADQANLGDFS